MLVLSAGGFRVVNRKRSPPAGRTGIHFQGDIMQTQTCGHQSTFGDKNQNCEACFAHLNRYVIYTGPTLVASAAERLRAAGFLIVTLGTQHLYVAKWDGTPEEILAALPTWRRSDVTSLG
jgi:hypothetical protein